MTTGYVGIVALAERLHRRSLDLLEAELARHGIADLNATQAMILLQMGQEQMTVSELTQRGCYQGTNVSYNLKKLIESGYVLQARSGWDRRVVRVRASEKGQALLVQLQRFYAALELELTGPGMDDLMARCAAGLARLERLSAGQLSRVTQTRPAALHTLHQAA